MTIGAPLDSRPIVETAGRMERVFQGWTQLVTTRANGDFDTQDISTTGSLSCGPFTSTGIDDNATSTAITIDSSESVGLGETSPTGKLDITNAAGCHLNLDATTSGPSAVNLLGGGSLLQAIGYEGSLRFGSITGKSLTGFSEHARIDASGNLLLGGTAPPASAASSLSIFNGTAPTGSVTSGVVLYSEDVSASAELKVRDEAGNVTTLSPHNFSLIPEGPSEPLAWAHYSEHDGQAVNVDMLKLARLVERLSGETLVYTENRSGHR